MIPFGILGAGWDSCRFKIVRKKDYEYHIYISLVNQS